MQEALIYEYQAANCLTPEEHNEPMRANLYCTAAWIAIWIEEFEQAKFMAQKGLEGYPSLRLTRELLAALFYNELTIYPISYIHVEN